MVEEEKQIQSIMAGCLLWLYIIDVQKLLKFTVQAARHTGVT